MPQSDILFCVFATFELSRSVSDKPQTMGGLSGAPNGTCFTDNIKPREPKLAGICY